MITAEKLREALVYDPATGVFTWLHRAGRPFSNRRAGKSAGHRCERVGSILLGIDGTLYRAHRLAWLYMTSKAPPEEVDHINCDPFDNRWSNLRLASRGQNCMNRRLEAKNTSGLKGAYFDKRTGRWLAQIKVGGKQHYLGKFDTPAEAHAAYSAAALRLHGEFARTS